MSEAAADLFEYGVHIENSDIRAHVSASDKTIYVFRTAEGLRAIETMDPPLRDAFQSGVAGRTALGWLVRPEWIADLRRLKFHSWPGWEQFYDPSLGTSEKGKLAVECVLAALRLGRFPLWIDAGESDRESVQIQGTDVHLFARKRIQIKCDLRAGETGNLFLQRAERNPRRRH